MKRKQMNKYQDKIDALDAESYAVTQNDSTERPFNNEFDEHFEEGIYLDKVSGKILFTSLEKYNSGCG